MPIPNPNRYKTKEAFMTDCMEVELNAGKGAEQAFAICATTYENRNMSTQQRVHQKIAKLTGDVNLISVGVNDDYAIIDDRLAYSTKEKAEEMAKNIGCEGHHTHEFEGRTWYMPCEKHMMAEVGPRGGIRRSKKAPRSSTPNPNPKRGSRRNKPGAASNTRGVKVPASVEKTLQKKADDFNERYKKKLGYGTSIAQLRTVYQRGVGAFQSGHSPRVSSQQQWALARVNAYLYLIKNGRPQNKKYTGDNDLLPKGHPKSDKK